MGVLKFIPIIGLLAHYSLAAAFCQPVAQQSTTHLSQPDRELTVVTKEAAPFAMKTPDGNWQGISIDLWRRLADQLHLRYRLVEVATVDGLMAATSKGEADAAVEIGRAHV